MGRSQALVEVEGYIGTLLPSPFLYIVYCYPEGYFCHGIAIARNIARRYNNCIMYKNRLGNNVIISLKSKIFQNKDESSIGAVKKIK